MHTTDRVVVTYTGKESPFIERNYGSGLEFAPNQSRAVPADLASKLLRHSDVFQPSKGKAPKDDASPDSTEAQLLAATERQSQAAALLDERQNVVDQIQQMDKDALREYSRTKYGQPLHHNLSAENMRAKVVGMIDMYGLV